MKIFDKRGSKLKSDHEIDSQHISAIKLHSENINGKDCLIFEVFLSTNKSVHLYTKTHEETSNWVASLLVAVSKGMAM